MSSDRCLDYPNHSCEVEYCGYAGPMGPCAPPAKRKPEVQHAGGYVDGQGRCFYTYEQYHELLKETAALRAENERLVNDYKELLLRAHERLAQERKSVLFYLEERAHYKQLAQKAEDALAQERERVIEECAKVCDAEVKQHDTGSGFDSQPSGETAFRLAKAIRALKEKP